MTLFFKVFIFISFIIVAIFIKGSYQPSSKVTGEYSRTEVIEYDGGNSVMIEMTFTLISGEFTGKLKIDDDVFAILEGNFETTMLSPVYQLTLNSIYVSNPTEFLTLTRVSTSSIVKGARLLFVSQRSISYFVYNFDLSNNKSCLVKSTLESIMCFNKDY